MPTHFDAATKDGPAIGKLMRTLGEETARVAALAGRRERRADQALGRYAVMVGRPGGQMAWHQPSLAVDGRVGPLAVGGCHQCPVNFTVVTPPRILTP